MEPLVLLGAFLLAFGTMFVGALSGGVGLLLRPGLLLLGIPPITVIGSVRGAAYAGELPALYVLHREKQINWKLSLFLSIPIFLGTLLASQWVLSLDQDALRFIVAGLLLVGAFILYLNRNRVNENQKPKYRPIIRHTLAVWWSMGIAFFGLITGGLGALYTSAYMWLYGKNPIGAAAIWRPASYIGAGLASILFVVNGVIDWQLCAVLAVGMMLGSYFGTKYMLKKGNAWLQWILIALVVGSALKLLFF